MQSQSLAAVNTMNRVILILAVIALGACDEPAPERIDSGAPDAAVNTGPFTLVVLPDTQYLTLSYFPIFDFNTRWIVEQKKKRNIVAVLHEGDITHNNTDAEWKNAVNSLSRLDGEVPYMLAVGNHDMKSGGDTSQFNKYFPLSKFSGLSTFGGSYPSGKMDSSYHQLSACGVGWLIFSLIYDPSDAVLTWADSVAKQHPDRRIIVVTHAYLSPTGQRTSIGERVWKGLVKKHAGMTLVFNGHFTGGVAARLVSDGDKGNKVYQMFTNYQHAQISGYGMFRLVTLDRAAKTISVSAYAPMKDWALTDDKNKFVYKDVALGAVK